MGKPYIHLTSYIHGCNNSILCVTMIKELIINSHTVIVYVILTAVQYICALSIFYIYINSNTY